MEKKVFIALLLMSGLIYQSEAQLIGEVYDVFQTHCVRCHSNGDKAGGLDLEGSSPTKSGRILQVYAKPGV